MSSQSDRAKKPRQYLVVIFANLLIIAAGVVVFSLVFRRHLEEVPASNYEVRDDAVITLSHARNLIDYGFIGVSPSGERVEGFSAPLQFWVAALAYASDGVDYRTFCRWQTTIGTLLLGGVFAALMFQPTRAQTSIWYVLFAVSAVLASADILAHSRRSYSGMHRAWKIRTRTFSSSPLSARLISCCNANAWSPPRSCWSSPRHQFELTRSWTW